MSEERMLIARNVNKAFGKFVALEGVDLELRRGERRALIGPNGAGKSTLISVIAGQQTPGAGSSVRLEGRDISSALPQEIARMGIGRTFQISRTFQKLTVLENMFVAMLPIAGGAMSLRRRYLSTLRDPLMDLLTQVGLAELAGKTVETISHSDRKRLEFCMVLASEPRLVLLDEPTAGMGLAERSELMEMMVSHIEKRGITLLFVEHDIDIVLRFADTITVMARGRVFAEGTPAEIMAHRGVQDIYLGAAH